MTRIELHNLETTCIVGILDQERQNRQRLRASIAVSLDTNKAARSCSIDDTLDYALLANATRFILDKAQFNLLETAADALARFVIASYRQLMIDQVQVTLDKPDILADTLFPRLILDYRAQDFFSIYQTHDYGRKEIIQDNNDCIINLYHLKAQQTITLDPQITILALSDKLERQTSGYYNPTSTTNQILTIHSQG